MKIAGYMQYIFIHSLFIVDDFVQYKGVTFVRDTFQNYLVVIFGFIFRKLFL